MEKTGKKYKDFNNLLNLVKKLRSPAGCPWDRKQKSGDIGKYILEEAYEVIDALEAKNHPGVKEELGDLLFQILFLAEIYEGEKLFSLNDIITAVTEKMVRRHPHVFGNKKVNSVRQVKDNWQKIKKAEREKKEGDTKQNLFAHVPRSMPALKRAQKITAIAADYGFDWSCAKDVQKKLQEEMREFSAALKNGKKNKIEEELGDILFTVVNLSRFAGVDAETALGKTTKKFLRRFSFVEKQLAAKGKSLKVATLKEMDNIWDKSKQKEL